MTTIDPKVWADYVFNADDYGPPPPGPDEADRWIIGGPSPRRACPELDEGIAGPRERITSADMLGALRTENDELLRDNARLRREVERLERKGKR